MATDYAVLKKGGFMRQKQKNNFSLRLRVVGGNLTAKQLAKIAEVSDKFGDGYVHLTSRQSVEIPFIKLDDIDEVKAALAEGDVEPGVCGPRVRTITACQSWRSAGPSARPTRSRASTRVSAARHNPCGVSADGSPPAAATAWNNVRNTPTIWPPSCTRPVPQGHRRVPSCRIAISCRSRAPAALRCTR